MPELPDTADTPFVRTDFANEKAWSDLVAEVGRESEDGFKAYISIIDDPKFDGCDPAVLAQLRPGMRGHAVLFVADSVTITNPDHAILCINLSAPANRFRVIPAQLWSVENNLSLANMDWEDFASAVDSDGVLRGFG